MVRSPPLRARDGLLAGARREGASQRPRGKPRLPSAKEACHARVLHTVRFRAKFSPVAGTQETAWQRVSGDKGLTHSWAVALGMSAVWFESFSSAVFIPLGDTWREITHQLPGDLRQRPQPFLLQVRAGRGQGDDDADGRVGTGPGLSLLVNGNHLTTGNVQNPHAARSVLCAPHPRRGCWVLRAVPPLPCSLLQLCVGEGLPTSHACPGAPVSGTESPEATSTRESPPGPSPGHTHRSAGCPRPGASMTAWPRCPLPP